MWLFRLNRLGHYDRSVGPFGDMQQLFVVQLVILPDLLGYVVLCHTRQACPSRMQCQQQPAILTH